MVRLSNAVVITANTILAVVGLAAIGLSVYAFIHGPSQCHRFFQSPLLVIATLLFFVSSMGLVAALYGSHVIMTLYLVFLFISIVFLILFPVFVFLLANHPSTGGDAFSDLRSKNWEGIRMCLSESRVCKSFGGHHRFDFYSNHLSSLQLGCCRPLAECGFQSKNATWWTQPSTAAAASTGDCKEWSNVQNQLCFGCESCKVGATEELRRDWKSLLVLDACLILFLLLLYYFGCSARRNNRVPWKRRFI